MTQAREYRGSRQLGPGFARKNRGFTVIELIIVLLIGSVLTAMALPQVQSGIYNYRLNSAVAMSKWAIQSTRFQALAKGLSLSGGVQRG